MRRKSRETAFKLIYTSLFEVNFDTENIYKEDNLSQEEIEYLNKIITVYNENKQIIENQLKNVLKGYEYDRVYKIDLALISVALCEYQFLEVPKAVAINEILEICKIYSTEKSPSFVNGILKDLLK